MTDTLDDKLRELQLELGSYDVLFVDKVKQLFADEGYKCFPNVSKYELAQGGYMTGQEWYDCFEKVLTDELTDGDPDYALEDLPNLDAYGIKDMLEAAKRAAGIQETKE